MNIEATNINKVIALRLNDGGKVQYIAISYLNPWSATQSFTAIDKCPIKEMTTKSLNKAH